MSGEKTCAWCSAPATTTDEAGDPQCEVCERQHLAAKINWNPTALDQRPGEPFRWYVQRLVRRLVHVRLNGPSSEESAVVERLARTCGVPL